MIMSGTGKTVRLRIGCGTIPIPLRFVLPQTMIFLSTSFSRSFLIGALRIVAVVGILCLWPREFLKLLISPLTLEVLLISTPRNLALDLPAFVIRVFSSDSSRFKCDFKKFLIFSLIRLAVSFDPATPIIQSSAYLT